MVNNRDSRSYLDAHWTPAPARVWMLTFVLGCVVCGLGAVALLVIF